MGANQSLEVETILQQSKSSSGAFHTKYNQDGHHQTTKISREKISPDTGVGKKRRAKPGPPHKPKILEATNNSITLTWLPPRVNNGIRDTNERTPVFAYVVEIMQTTSTNKKEKDGKIGSVSDSKKSQFTQGHWTTLTKTCQATTYTARNLESDVAYTFRVRAENVHGTGKPSVPSEPATTHIFETSSLDCITSYNPSSPSHSNGPSSPTASSPVMKFDYSGVRNFNTPTTRNADCPPDQYSDGITSQEYNANGDDFRRVRRRHSFNVHLDGKSVTKIVNHSDIHVGNPNDQSKTSSPTMPQSTSCHAALYHKTDSTSTPQPSDLSQPLSQRLSPQRSSFSGSSNGSARQRLLERNIGCSKSFDSSTGSQTSPTSSTMSLYRKNSCTYDFNRKNSSSITKATPPSGRKISLPILLPGTGTDSLSRLRESRTSLRSNASESKDQNYMTRNGLREVVTVTIGESHVDHKSKRISNGSSGSDVDSGLSFSSEDKRHSQDNISPYNTMDVINTSPNNSIPTSKRASRTSIGSGASDMTCSRFSTDESVSSGVSSAKSSRASSIISSAASSTSCTSPEGDSTYSRRHHGSLSSLSKRSCRSDATLSNSKDGSKDSLCDISALSVGSNSSGDNRSMGSDVDGFEKSSCIFGSDTTMKFTDTGDSSIYNPNTTEHNNSSYEINNGANNQPNIESIYALGDKLQNCAMIEENVRNFNNQNITSLKSIGDYNSYDIYDGGSFVSGKGSYYESLENPWEKGDSTNHVSEQTFEAPHYDGVNMTFFAQDLQGIPSLGRLTDQPKQQCKKKQSRVPSGNFGEAGDFRTLRSVLQSNSMFVKAQMFSPDVVGVVVGEPGHSCRTLTRAPLSTIVDADEEEESAVRITTL